MEPSPPHEFPSPVKPCDDATAADLLRVALGDWGDGLAEGTADDGEGMDRYRLIRMIGEGGFGEVWEAEQREPVQRIVAVKLVKPGMDTRQVVHRFERERQTLAMMDHPGIASIFDGGATADGRPYFAMEKVDGPPITDYCDRHRFTVRQRVELFILVCQAVHHAHQKGALHRDLKPSNLLVTEIDGVAAPKVIDFGIAKVLTADATPSETMGAWILGTPAYMSPEQAAFGSSDIDTRADIYSLGVLLFELLTGKAPLSGEETDGLALDEWIHRIRHVDPPRPSVQAATASDEVHARRSTRKPHLEHQLRGDLDWIVLKTLRKDREQRYDSAAALALDLRAYLNDQPVSAARPSLAVTLRKLARRHRAFVVAATVSALALLTAAAFSTLSYFREARMRTTAEKAQLHAEAQEREAEQQRDLALISAGEARRQTEKSEKTLAYLEALLDRAADHANRGRNPEALRLALDDVTSDISSFTDDADLRESILARSTIIYRRIGDAERAIPLVRAQLEITEDRDGPTSLSTLTAMIHLVRALSQQNRHAEAVAEANELVSRWKSLGPEAWHSRHAFMARRDRADVLKRAGRLDEALTEFATLHAETNAESRHYGSWFVFVRFYTAALRDARRFDEASALLRETLASLPADLPDLAHHQSQFHREESRLQMALGNIPASAAALQTSIRLEEEAHGPERHDLSARWVELSRLQDLQGFHEAAVGNCQRAVEIAATIGDQDQRVAALRALGENLENGCRFAESAKAWKESAARGADLELPLHDRLLDLAHAARNLCRADQLDEAVALAAEIHQSLPDLPFDSASFPNRRLIRAALAPVIASDAFRGAHPLPADWLLIAHQLARSDLPGLTRNLAERRDSGPHFLAAHEAIGFLASDSPPDDSLRTPDAAAFLAYDRAINERWSDLDSSGSTFHAAACLRLLSRPDLALPIYQAIASLPPDQFKVPGRALQARLQLAACLMDLDRASEARTLVDAVEEALRLNPDLPPTPRGVDLLTSLRREMVRPSLRR